MIINIKQLRLDLLSILILTGALIVLDILVFNNVILWFSRALVFEAGIPKTIIFLCIYFAINFSLACFLLIKKVSVLVFIGSYLLLTINSVYQSVNNEAFSILDLETALTSSEFLFEALTTYSYPIALSIALTTLYIPIFFLAKSRGGVSNIWIVIALIGLSSGIFLSERSQGSYIRSYPRYLSAGYVVYQVASMDKYIGKRQLPFFSPKHPPLAQHIIFIVDESIRGDSLQINGASQKNTPYLSSIKDDFLNYGIASSFSNSSSSSNYAMLTGLKMEELPDKDQKSRKYPLIFSYANNTVDESHFIYGQGDYSAQIKKFNLAGISQHYIVRDFSELKTEEIDTEIIKQLDNITQQEKSTFSWVNKYGCHFNYDHSYPNKNATFTPLFADDQKNRDYLINSYSNCILWAVDYFMEKLLTTLKGRNILIVYTSDHGQSLMEDAIPGTHNRTFNVPSVQANVPLFVFGTDVKSKRVISDKYLVLNNNKTAAENLFPTLLYFMGFDNSDILKKYSSTIFSPIEARQRTFLSGNLLGSSNYVINKFDSK